MAKRKINNSKFYYRSCTGCLESEDGHPIGDYPFDEKRGCLLGSGCRECGQRGYRKQYYDDRDPDEETEEL